MTQLEVYGFADAERGTIRARIDGVLCFVPADAMFNSHRRLIADWEAEGNTIPNYAPPAPTVSEVKAEAQRRIEAIMPSYKQSNFHAQFAETAMTYGVVPSGWPAELQQVLGAAMAQWAQIKAIRARSNEIEAMNPIPADMRDDSYWSAT